MIKLDKDLQKKFNRLPRTGSLHEECGHPILDPYMVGAHSCDNFDCDNMVSFTVLSLYLEQNDRNQNKLLRRFFSFITQRVKRGT